MPRSAIPRRAPRTDCRWSPRPNASAPPFSGDSNAFASLRYKCEGMASNSRKPVIGLSLGLHDFGDYAGVGHQRPLALAGGVGFTLPRVDGYLDDALDACDGILFGGGRDIDPRRYGQAPTEPLGTTDPLRD